jgi:uncharacterized protein YndB with AHSA1/START domain
MSNIYKSEAERSHTTQRSIDAPISKVFRAFSDPAKLCQWWGPEGFTNSFTEFDLREGGYWRFTMHGPDGTDYPNESRFIEVVSNNRVVIEHLLGHHFIQTITFIADGDATIVNWQQMFDTIEHYQEISEFVSQANEQNLDRLESVVSDSKSRTCQSAAVGQNARCAQR